MTVTGLIGNNFYINNPLFIDIDADTPVDVIKLTIQNKDDTLLTRTFELFTNDNKAKINLTSLIRSFFALPNATFNFTTDSFSILNINNFKLDFKGYLNGVEESAFSLESRFVRGGGNNDLKFSPLNQVLTNSVKVPRFDGYPSAKFRVLDEFGAQANKIKMIPYTSGDIDFETLEPKGRNGCFIWFLNSFGGYSGWYFHEYEKGIKTEHKGFTFASGSLKDFGSEFKKTIKCYSKVPKRYREVVNDLAVSPEIYLYKGGNDWQRIVGVNTNLNTKFLGGEFVELNFELPTLQRTSML